jgi:hypothetical protein
MLDLSNEPARPDVWIGHGHIGQTRLGDRYAAGSCIEEQHIPLSDKTRPEQSFKLQLKFHKN